MIILLWIILDVHAWSNVIEFNLELIWNPPKDHFSKSSPFLSISVTPTLIIVKITIIFEFREIFEKIPKLWKKSEFFKNQMLKSEFFIDKIVGVKICVVDIGVTNMWEQNKNF